jgi:Coenzyme PQQ synthesis protein D (PqqD)
MDNGSLIRKNPQVVYRSLADEGGVLLHLESGQYHGLNEMGRLIWGLLNEDTTLESLVADLREHLLDPPDDLSREVERFLTDLRERDLLAP